MEPEERPDNGMPAREHAEGEHVEGEHVEGEHVEGEQADGAFRFGDWHVEPATGTLRRADEETRLEPRVMSLLCLLAGRPGHVFPKEEIFDRIWEQAFVEDATLTRCISDLRRALGDDARQPRYVQTVPKKGYRAVARVRSDTDPPETGEPSAAETSREDGRGPDSAETAMPARTKSLLVGAMVLLALALGLLALAGARLLDREPESPELTAYDYYLQGRDHYKRYRRADNEQAIELYRQALEIDPDFALAHAELANALAIQKGNFHLPGPWAEEALAAARRAIELQPELPEGHKALGHALSLESRFREAAASYRRALELRPGYREAVHNLSLMLLVMGRLDEALAGFESYHEGGQGTADSFQHIGWIYSYLSMPEEAETWFRHSLELEPHHIGSQRGLALLESSRGDHGAARRRLEALCSIHPDCLACRTSAGDAELAAGNEAGAEALYRQALDKAGGTFPYAALRLAQVLGLSDEASRRLQEVEEAARDALAASNEDPQVLWILAAALALQDDPEAAIEHLKKAVEAGWRRGHLDDPVFARLRSRAAYQDLLEENRAALSALRQRIQEG